MSEPLRIAAQNRRARHDYIIESSIEAGLMLTGSEVKSLRAGKVSIKEAYARERGVGQINVDALYEAKAHFSR